jgi:hypothetical protein
MICELGFIVGITVEGRLEFMKKMLRKWNNM